MRSICINSTTSSTSEKKIHILVGSQCDEADETSSLKVGLQFSVLHYVNNNMAIAAYQFLLPGPSLSSGLPAVVRENHDGTGRWI
jgi:hypothetical protein